jgi:hypothetical protein
MVGEGLPVEVACRVLCVSCAGFYAWRFRPPSARAVLHAWWLTDVIHEVHAASYGNYGAKRVHAERPAFLVTDDLLCGHVEPANEPVARDREDRKWQTVECAEVAEGAGAVVGVHVKPAEFRCWFRTLPCRSA